MRIGFIGSGNVAMAFGLYLKDKNQTVSGYFSKSTTSAKTAAELVSTTAFTELEQLLEASDCIGITTGDDQIEIVVHQLYLILKESDSFICKNFFHMSGAKSSNSLYPLKALGHQCFSLHPLQTISEPLSGKRLLENCTFTLEGEVSRAIDQWAETLFPSLVRITEAQKASYHVAACMASNYLYTLVNSAVEAMMCSGFSEENAFKALKPLMLGTLENCSNTSPSKGLTGPIARGDVGTVRKHLEALMEEPKLSRMYRTMGLETLQLASLEKLKDKTVISELEQLLKSSEDSGTL